jgi:hypothetical protein
MSISGGWKGMGKYNNRRGFVSLTREPLGANTHTHTHTIKDFFTQRKNLKKRKNKNDDGELFSLS